jgi:hypothetical protein
MRLLDQFLGVAGAFEKRKIRFAPQGGVHLFKCSVTPRDLSTQSGIQQLTHKKPLRNIPYGTI